MKRTTLALIAVLLFAAGAAAQTGEILKLKEQIIQIQNKGALGFRNFTLCSVIQGFGSYTPLEKAVVPAGGELLVYYEPENVFTVKREGLYEIWYTQNMALLDAAGKTLQEWEDILAFKHTARTPILDLFATNSLDLEGLPPGAYKFKAVLKDRSSNKEAARTVDFTVK